MNVFTSKTNNFSNQSGKGKSVVTIIIPYDNTKEIPKEQSLYEKEVSLLIKRIETIIISLRVNRYEELASFYEQRLLVLKKDFNNNLLALNDKENISINDKVPVTLRLKNIEYHLRIYIVKLNELYQELEMKSITSRISNLYKNLNQKDLTITTEEVLEIKKFFFQNIRSYSYLEQERIRSKLYELIYALVKKEFIYNNDSLLHRELDNSDKELLNYFLVKDISENLNNQKELQQALIDKINLMSNKPFNVEVIRKYIEILLGRRPYKKPTDKRNEEIIIIKRRFVSNTKISPSEFHDITGIWPFPHNKDENLTLRNYDISCVDYKGQSLENCNFSYTNIKFKVSEIYKCALTHTNLEGVDLRNIDFESVIIQGTNFKNTNAEINFQKLGIKSAMACNFEGLDLSEADFTGIYIKGSNFRYTNAKINPQKIPDKDLSYGDYEGLDLRDADFTDVRVEYANFKNTGAIINPQTVRMKSFYMGNFEGLDLSNADFTGIDLGESILKDSKAIIDPRVTKCLYKTDLRGCMFVINDFTNCNIEGTIFDEGFTPYIRGESNKSL